MNSILVLVDFDNYVRLNDVPGQNPKQFHVDIALEHLMDVLSDWALKLNSKPDEIQVRIYGGWYENEMMNSKTDLRSMIESYCIHARRYVKKIRWRLALAESIMANETVVFTNSLQTYPFKLKINGRVLSDCSTRQSCMTKIVNNWQENGCPGCGDKHVEILKRKLQKTVDSQIVCDIVYATNLRQHNRVCIVSADYDMAPGIVYGLTLGMPMTMFRNNHVNHYDRLIPGCEFVVYEAPDFKRRRR